MNFKNNIIPANELKKLAVKYNGNQLDYNTKTSNYDYMVFNLDGVPLFDRVLSSCTVEQSEYGNSVFRNMAHISFNKERFCTLSYNPRNFNLGQKLVQLKVQNHVLYLYPLAEIKRVIKEICNTLGLRIDGVSRLDVCVDYEDASDSIRKIIKGIITNDLLISGRKKDVKYFNTYGETSKGLMQYNGFAVGKKSSARFLRVYNKTLEMHDVKFKQHIYNDWVTAGFTDFDNIWRYEYQLDSSFMKAYGIGFDDVFSDTMVVKLLKIASKNHFELRYNAGYSEINKNPDCPFIDLDAIEVVDSIDKIVVQLSENIQRSLVSVKRQIKGLYRSFYSTDSDFFYDAMFVHLRNYDLVDWFKAKQPDYLKEFEKNSLILKSL